VLRFPALPFADRVRFGTTIALCPSLVITRTECDRIVETLDRALQALAID